MVIMVSRLVIIIIINIILDIKIMNTLKCHKSSLIVSLIQYICNS